MGNPSHDDEYGTERYQLLARTEMGRTKHEEWTQMNMNAVEITIKDQETMENSFNNVVDTSSDCS